MACSIASMLRTWHQIAADLFTAPALVVVRVDAFLDTCLLAAEARFCRPHTATGWAGPSMAQQLARMRTLFRRNSWSPAGLPTRVGRQARQWPRIELLFTPARVVRWHHFFGQVTSRTSPDFDWASDIVIRASPRIRIRILRPPLHATQMKDRPTRPTRPYLGVRAHLVRTYRTLVDLVGNVLMYPCDDIWSR